MKKKPVKKIITEKVVISKPEKLTFEWLINMVGTPDVVGYLALCAGVPKGMLTDQRNLAQGRIPEDWESADEISIDILQCTALRLGCRVDELQDFWTESNKDLLEAPTMKIKRLRAFIVNRCINADPSWAD